MISKNCVIVRKIRVRNYLRIVSGKTAALFATSMYVGASESDCTEDFSKNLGHIGFDLGIAFQIIDDIGIRAVRDERSELVELITLLLDFNEHRDNLIKPDLRIVVTVIQNGVMTINLEF
jgi:hypothetical protein